jgi:Protein of unknown function (DUF3619)
MTSGFKSTFSTQDVFARRVVQKLDNSLDDLPHHVSERLRVARLRALDLHKRSAQQLAFSPSIQIQNGVATLGRGPASESDYSVFWEKLVSFLPLIVLLLGLMIIHEFQNDSRVRELADVDQALLLDDLPPDAYTDPGFLKFLSVPRESVESAQQ